MLQPCDFEWFPAHAARILRKTVISSTKNIVTVCLHKQESHLKHRKDGESISNALFINGENNSHQIFSK